jgi:hypothetical protein
MVAGDPRQGGAAWAVLQYILGLADLGHRVLLVEPVDALTQQRVAMLREVELELGLAASCALLAPDRTTAGLPYGDVLAHCRGADLLLNVSGMLEPPELLEPIPVRVYLDLDPVFNQLWDAGGIDMRFAAHTHFATVGQTLGSARAPTQGRRWLPTLPPVVLARWQACGRPVLDAFTTVLNWRSYGSIEHDGTHYGQKAHSLRRLIRLPLETRQRFELALAIHCADAADRRALERHGWALADPDRVAGTPRAYRSYVQRSRAEIAIAKSGYVESRCGWFSDRSACYLSSGRPVLAQDTGFGEALPTGEGLLRFSTVDEAAAGAEAVLGDYRRHSKAARALAEAHLDSRRVLTRLIERVGVAA